MLSSCPFPLYNASNDFTFAIRGEYTRNWGKTKPKRIGP
jgi:hypothetical protein